ncbi:AAA family ATPase [Tumebacillus flagellatus]|uniref:ATPase dynein-related AAA domain-containing protein n=1 Tax=Tumebacillus flagellatus TaxID=1157490 RepID=A0A074LW98_9BACL|nr:AAA family ATPase [Tumebacillus flagellatus]KEO85119.1 hypothetical protein EL26_00740 [Tumebacillus flagellatus]
MLKDLGVLASNCRIELNRAKIFGDIKLTDSFKRTFSNCLGGDTIQFFEYTAILTRSSGDKKIYLPNHWFILAAYLTEYVVELEKYKKLLEVIINKSINRSYLWDTVVKGLKDGKVSGDELRKMINEYLSENEDDARYLWKFLTDYNWWNGSKTIERQDYFVSPVLSLLGVVAVTQTYIAEIAKLYVENSTLLSESMVLIDKLESLVLEGTIEGDQEQPKSAPPEQRAIGGSNLIVYGAPGTGKSFLLENDNSINNNNILRVTFHPEYTYYDFVGTYKPVPVYRGADGIISEGANGEPLIDYRFTPGPFAKILRNALEKKQEMHLLIIEEINRANAASVFGDLFQLLDRKASGESEYRINTDEHLLRYLGVPEVYIPSNLSISATMNSADQGVFVLDSAFKRRWKFRYMPIKFDSSVPHRNEIVQYSGREFTWEYFVRSINDKLGRLGINEDKHIGPYFLKIGEPSNPDSIASKLLIYLWDDVVRYHRREFFGNVNTFAELVENYYNGENIIPSIEIIPRVIRNSKETEKVEE